MALLGRGRSAKRLLCFTLVTETMHDLQGLPGLRLGRIGTGLSVQQATPCGCVEGLSRLYVAPAIAPGAAARATVRAACRPENAVAMRLVTRFSGSAILPLSPRF